MSRVLFVTLQDESAARLERIAGARKVEELAAEAIEIFLTNREDAARRVADAGFLFTARNRAR